jgi:excisionase family DNA binding protein
MMKPKKRTYNPRRARTGQSYSVQEIAELYGMAKNSVRRWVKDGLPFIDKRGEYLIHGSDLREFLQKKRSGRKRKCTPDEFFCCRCRAQRKPMGGMVDIIVTHETKVRLSGLCAVCGATINRVGSVEKMPEYQKIFSTRTIGGERISASASPVVNVDFKREKRA